MTLQILRSIARVFDREKQSRSSGTDFQHLRHPYRNCLRFLFDCGYKIRPAIEEHWPVKLSIAVHKAERRFVFLHGKEVVAEALFIGGLWELRILPNQTGH